ncbi:MAG TPA: RNA methyltransferase [Tepidisphaeraceae bacterium]|nr:RNA methyltransferase [Tepidisphaeraceae bacterium]
MSSSTIIPVESLSDPRIAVYLNLKERELAREGGRFIAEGEMVVRRLLASDYPVESVLMADRHVEKIPPLVPPGVPIYMAPAAVVNQIVGYKFHSGVMACGVRKPRLSIEQIASSWTSDKPVVLTVLPEIANTENMGALIRISAAFGVNAMILGQHSCDPYYRQSIRVSMGNIFSVPIVQCEDLLSDLRLLRERWNVQLLATVLDETAEPLARSQTAARMGILFGGEGPGLRADEIAACDRRITIPMQMGTDSLNVSVAAAVILYHFTQYAR